MQMLQIIKNKCFSKIFYDGKMYDTMVQNTDEQWMASMSGLQLKVGPSYANFYLGNNKGYNGHLIFKGYYSDAL